MVESAELPDKLHGWLLSAISTIVVASGLYPPRREFTVAHELGHANCPPGVDPEHVEIFCDRFAAALMMPARPFLESGTACDWELPVLQAWWPHCSPMALLRRIVDLVEGDRVSAWTRSRMRLRVSGGQLAWYADELEAFAASEAVHGVGRSELREGGLRVRAWRTEGERAVVLVQRS